MKKRMLSAFLCLCLVLSLLPVPANAAPMLQEVRAEDDVYWGWLTDVETETRVRFDYEVPEDGAAVLIFFKTSCGNCQYAFSQLNEQPWVHNDKINFYAIESSEYTCEDIRTFQSQQAPDITDTITWMDTPGYPYICSDYLYAAGLDGSGWLWPVVAVCTEEEGQRYIRYIDSGVTDVRRIGNSLESLLGLDLGVPKPVPLQIAVEEHYDLSAGAVDAVNAHRAAQSLPALQYNAQLTRLAMERAAELAIYHQESRPNGVSVYDLMAERFPGLGACHAAIVISWKNPEDFLSQLLENGWDRFNLELTDYTQVGIGCVYANGVNFWCLMMADDSIGIDPEVQTGIVSKRVFVDTYLSVLPAPGVALKDILLYPGQQSSAALYGDIDRYDIPLIPSACDSQIIDSVTGQSFATAQLQSDGTIRITADAPGSGTLRVWAYEGQEEPYESIVTVSDAPEYRPHTIHTAHSGNGQLLLSREQAIVDERIELTVLPDEGWWLASLYVEDGEGNPIPCYSSSQADYVFFMPISDVYISAAFLPQEVPQTPFSVNQEILGNGWLSFRDYTFYATEPVTFSVHPGPDMVLSGLTVTDEAGQALELTDNGDGTYTFRMPQSHVLVQAAFCPLGGYRVDLNYSGCGTASASAATAYPGEEVVISCFPDEGCEVGFYYIDLPEDSYTWQDENTLVFTMPDYDVLITLSFLEKPVYSGPFGEGLTWALEEDTLIISGQGSMGTEMFSSATLPWGSYTEQICHVVIEPGVTNICAMSFAYHQRLRTVTIPDTVESIDLWAFLNCIELTTIYLNGLPEEGIHDSAFAEVTADVIVPDGDRRFTADVTLDYGGDLNWNHSYLPTVSEATCTEGGYTAYTCNCGDSFLSEEVPALGHRYENGVCDRCGEADPNYQKPVENPFSDVPEGEWYFEPVLWAVENGITSGTSATTFAPNQTCTRAQVVTFLWRAMGSPEPESAENPFSDVMETDYFYSAVLWAVEEGITSGTGSGQFSPNRPCTRDQVVTFLWRTMGEPAPEKTENPFTDVAEGIYYYQPVLWAVENNITSGISATTFAPSNPCTRAQVVTFLFRALKEK